MLTVEGIYIYPIKSLGGISVQSAYAFEEGFEYDRRWMLVNSDGEFVTQRENSLLALFKTHLDKNGIQVQFENDSILIPFDLKSEIIRKVNVFEHHLKAQEVDPKINQWFSERLNASVQMVKMTDVSNRSKYFIKPPFKTKVSLADGYPYLVLGTASMDNLNSKLDDELNMNRFRPNIFVNTLEPHEEDEWNNISIGKTKFKVIKPCGRCIITTIDQQSSVKGKEPLKTLATYRKKQNMIYFGANMIVEKQGQVKVGDILEF